MTEKQFNKCAKVLLIAVFGVLYLVSPIDAVPDPLFPVGILDDIGVLVFGTKKVRQPTLF